MKGATIAGAVTALPIGEAYVAAKAVRRARMKNKNDNWYSIQYVVNRK